MRITAEGKKYLRELSLKVLEISKDPIQNEKICRWKALNSLKKGSPLILCSPPGEAWSEIFQNQSPVMEDPLLRYIEYDLRQRIYKWENIRDDDVITSNVYVPVIHSFSGWIDGDWRSYSGKSEYSGKPEPCLNEYNDLKKLKFPRLEMDLDRSRQNYDQVQDAVGDILNVFSGMPYGAGTYLTVHGWGTSMMDVLCQMRGLGNIFYDLYENPEFVHEAMSTLTQGTINVLDSLEKEKILRFNNNEAVVGPGGLGYTDELNSGGKGQELVSICELWGYAQTQEFSEVSPDMLEEFVLPYQAKLLERFGLNYYGCCEPNDKKWKLIKKYIPKLRAVSVSPWADVEIAAAELSDKYVYSWKPNPSSMISTFNEEYIKSEIRRVFEITKDCCMQVSLRDTLTLCGEPGRLGRWVELARTAAMEI